ncbi:hypothetical protein NDU88_002932 [Pleurodeles waltl]|uniref:Uncharacterized protein n=1 Tax=Pleurodeles waltl TaxID=8319 RepID=A0AAV7RBG0_PLEWA|nr:hypothetical protein NDU88_002932 [Pleurodeles waltl]
MPTDEPNRPPQPPEAEAGESHLKREQDRIPQQSYVPKDPDTDPMTGTNTKGQDKQAHTKGPGKQDRKTPTKSTRPTIEDISGQQHPGPPISRTKTYSQASAKSPGKQDAGRPNSSNNLTQSTRAANRVEHTAATT